MIITSDRYGPEGRCFTQLVHRLQDRQSTRKCHSEGIGHKLDKSRRCAQPSLSISPSRLAVQFTSNAERILRIG